jgi:hypothetical protein
MPGRFRPARPRWCAADRSMKPSAKPIATTSRSSTTKVCGSGCDATYGTGSVASMEMTPVPVGHPRCDLLEHRDVGAVAAGNGAGDDRKPIAAHSTSICRFRKRITWPLPSVGAPSAPRVVFRARADR